MKLDRFDRIILTALQRDGRVSNVLFDDGRVRLSAASSRIGHGRLRKIAQRGVNTLAWGFPSEFECCD